ncbi:hypothetical protein MACH09_46430 [Vibrio sp. MACH09]|uniref:hypothetical protein n=1 Tax=Vibrio sp. MACH09 TaxID=3025122 RepID=UPI002790BB82|nr:hypothetical protein [Vibrio sp. MACH09]GLO64135.1 hypothetical protein MACH09_46430 [Vibrio sp. MACH09]
MTKSTKLHVLVACVVLCLVVIAVLGYSTWTVHKKIAELEKASASTYWIMNLEPPQASKNKNIRKSFGTMPEDFSQMYQRMYEMINNMQPRSSLLIQRGFGALQQSSEIDFEESNNEIKPTIEILEGEEIELSTEIFDGLHKGSCLFSLSQYPNKFFDDPVDQAVMEVISEIAKTIVRIPKLTV